MVVGAILLPPTRSPGNLAPLPVYDDHAFVEHGSYAEVIIVVRTPSPPHPPANWHLCLGAVGK